MSRVIFHVDINAFFASAEEIRNPELKDKPVAIAHRSRKSVITTANYVAREFGVRSAMPLAHALKLCPKLEVVDVDFEYYDELSEEFIALLKEYSPDVEQASIDEAYIDVSEAIQAFAKPLDLATEIQTRILEELNLPTSIGVAPNKFLAKMASDFKKPLGISVLRIKEVEQKLWPLPVGAMFGVGKKSEAKLRAMGIVTIADFAQTKLEVLTPVLGINADLYLQRAHGLDNQPIVNTQVYKSFSQSRTFTDEINDEREIRKILLSFCTELAHRLEQAQLSIKGLGVSLRFSGYSTAIKSMKLDSAICSESDLYEKALYLLDQFDSDDLVDYMGLNVYHLVERDSTIDQLDLFNLNTDNSVQDIINELNRVYKKDIFKRADAIIKDSHD